MVWMSSGIQDCREDAVLALAHRGVGQADDHGRRIAVAGVDLDMDGNWQICNMPCGSHAFNTFPKILA